MILRIEEEKTEGAKRPKASVSERAGVSMKISNARSLLEGLTSSWSNPVRREERLEGLRRLPPELITSAVRSSAFGTEKLFAHMKEKLEQLR